MKIAGKGIPFLLTIWMIVLIQAFAYAQPYRIRVDSLKVDSKIYYGANSAQLKGPIVSVAGKNAPAIYRDAMANYVCDGVDDQVQITAAMDYISTNFNGGGTVFLIGDSFFVDQDTLSYCIFFDSTKHRAISIKGEGKYTTTIKIEGGANATAFGIYKTSRVSLSDFTIDGNDANNTAGGGIYPIASEEISLTNIHIDSVQAHAVSVLSSKHVYIGNVTADFSTAGHGIDIDRSTH